MGHPTVNISAEPVVSGSLVYAPLAAGTAFSPPTAQYSLCLDLTSKETWNLKLEGLVSYFTPPYPFPKLFWYGYTDLGNPLTIPPVAQPTRYHFESYNNRIHPAPVPTKVELNVFCQYSDKNVPKPYDEWIKLPLPLKPHVNSVPKGAFAFPGKSEHLGKGEFWQGQSAVHRAGFQGSELFAYDLIVVAFDKGDGWWSEISSGGSSNEDYRVWKQPVYAMADGHVIAVRNDMKDNKSNTPPDKLPVSGPDALGNHAQIMHGTEVVTYGHLHAVTVKSGDKVTGGKTQIGLAGNSGFSSRPSLHVSVDNNQQPTPAPRPLLFRDIHVIDQNAYWGNAWVAVSGQALPPVSSLIWPEPVFPPPPPPYSGIIEFSVPIVPTHSSVATSPSVSIFPDPVGHSTRYSSPRQ